MPNYKAYDARDEIIFSTFLLFDISKWHPPNQVFMKKQQIVYYFKVSSMLFC